MHYKTYMNKYWYFHGLGVFHGENKTFVKPVTDIYETLCSLLLIAINIVINKDKIKQKETSGE